MGKQVRTREHLMEQGRAISSMAVQYRRGERLKQERFQKALAAEGLGCGIGYIGKPIYLCTEALWGKKTYGDSKFPFDSSCARPVEYAEGDCPNAEEFMSHVLTFAYNENWTEAHLDDAEVHVHVRPFLFETDCGFLGDLGTDSFGTTRSRTKRSTCST